MSTGTNRERLEQNNLKLEDIKTQIQNLPEAGGSGDVKLFETEEEMQADTTAKEGDLAIVYRSEVQSATVDSKFQTATFPDTVVLDTAITNSIEVRYRAVDSSKMFDCWGSLDSSRFSMDCYTESGSIRIQYTSSDGITYTRTDTTGNPVDFGTEIYYERPERWNDAIGKFIQIGGSVFKGLYEYKLNVADETVLWFASINDISFDYANNSISNVKCSNPYFRGISRDKIVNVLRNIKLNANVDSTTMGVAVKDNGKLIALHAYNSNDSSYKDYSLSYIGYNTSKNYIGLVSDWNNSHNEIHYWEIDEDTFEPVNIEPIVLNAELNVIQNYAGFSLKLQSVPRIYSFASKTFTDSPCLVCGDSTNNTKCYIDSVVGNDFIYKKYDKYIIAPTQLTAMTEYVYGKEFYGKNGVESGTLQNKENLTKDEVKHRVGIWSNYNSGIVCPSDSSNMFSGFENLTTIPLLDTSNVTSTEYMFYNCENLTTIPLLNTSNVTNMSQMFGGFNGCTSLSDESLNNILAMCKNATSYTGTKTLKYIGLTSAQANKCKTLSNYSAFTSAGWTTGY